MPRRKMRSDFAGSNSSWLAIASSEVRQACAEFCQRWHIIEFAVFGSVLRDDFLPNSDIDVLGTLQG